MRPAALPCRADAVAGGVLSEAAGVLAAQRAEGGAAPSLRARLDTLARLDAMLLREREAFAAAISADFGNRARPETMLAELVPLRAAIAHARRHLARWMRPRRHPVAMAFQFGRAWVRTEPLGCVGIVSPWNYPLLLGLSPVIDALAAGNRVMLKPSELTPCFSGLLAGCLGEAFPATQVAVVQGGREVGEAFVRLPFDHLLFTGSTAVGREVLRAAAERLTPVTLELGGKSPVVVGDDIDLARAARIVAVGKLFSAGQTCIAPDYALVRADRAEDFARLVAAEAARMLPMLAGNPDCTAIISPGHFARLQGAVREAEAGGARLLRHPVPDDAAGRRMGPVVVLDPPADGALMREEIFGPVLPVVAVRDLDAALGFLAARPHPLALYCLSDDAKVRRRVLEGTVSGGVAMNATLLHCAQPSLPFGGRGPSGMGAYHGEDGFRRFSHRRAVFAAGRLNGAMLLTPPHGRAMALLLRALLRG